MESHRQGRTLFHIGHTEVVCLCLRLWAVTGVKRAKFTRRPTSCCEAVALNFKPSPRILLALERFPAGMSYELPPPIAELYVSDAELEQLTDAEVWWRDHQKWLAEKGYMLRPRYRPGWVPSWKAHPNKNRRDFEDWHFPTVRALCRAPVHKLIY